MKEDEYLFAVRDNKSRSRYWLAGLSWAPLEKQTVRLPFLHMKSPRRSPVKGFSVRVVTDRNNSRSQQNRVQGRGCLPARHRRHQLYSLALAFCARTRNGYGIYRLNSTDFLFLASINGLPAVMADKTGSQGRMQELLTLFITMNEAPADGWDCRASVETPEEVAVLVSSFSPRERRHCRVQTDGLRGQRWIPVALMLLVTGGAAAWWHLSQPPEEPVLTAEEIQARAKAMFAKPAPPPALPHPWARQILTPALLAHCQALQSPAPSVLEAWSLASGSCSAEGVTLLYRIMPGGTAEGFRNRSREYFGITPVINLTEGGREATVPLPLPDSPVTDEVVPEASTQLMRILSWFQRRQVVMNIALVPSPAGTPGANGEPLPPPDWKEYTFTFSSQLPPAILFDGMDSTGVRLTRVTFELNGSAFSYTTEGHIYASTQ